MTTRDLSNKRIKVAYGAANAIANLLQPSLAEANAMLDATPSIRFDGYDFGMQESDQEDDRSLADEASATIRSFAQFGGAVPHFMPKVTDTGSVLRQVFNLTKARNTELVVLERVGFQDWSQPFAAGDIVNPYRVITDGWTPDTEGTGGYAYLLNLVPKGESQPWFILPPATPVAVTTTGGATGTLTVGGVNLREAFYQGHNITGQGTWTSSNPAVAYAEDGLIVGVSAGTATVIVTYPGALASTAITYTVS